VKVGDLVRTKETQHTYGYQRPVCVVVSAESRIDGLVIDMMDPKGDIRRWLEEDLEVIHNM
jgi:hypothetical protein